jgi:hypothetical protein
VTGGTQAVGIAIKSKSINNNLHQIPVVSGPFFFRQEPPAKVYLLTFSSLIMLILFICIHTYLKIQSGLGMKLNNFLIQLSVQSSSSLSLLPLPPPPPPPSAFIKPGRPSTNNDDQIS